MAKVKIKITREDKANVDRSFILINDRVLPLDNRNEINIYVELDVEYGITVYCQGPRNANTTAKIKRSTGNVIEPLTANVNNDYGVSHASDVFTVKTA